MDNTIDYIFKSLGNVEHAAKKSIRMLTRQKRFNTWALIAFAYLSVCVLSNVRHINKLEEELDELKKKEEKEA